MAESEDYNAENEDYKRRGGETEITGDDVTGEEGSITVTIPDGSISGREENNREGFGLDGREHKEGCYNFRSNRDT